jgi:endonuclease III
MSDNLKEIKLILNGNKVSFKSKNCNDGKEQLRLVMNRLMRILASIKLSNNLTDIEMEEYYKTLLEDMKKGVLSIYNEVKHIDEANLNNIIKKHGN